MSKERLLELWESYWALPYADYIAIIGTVLTLLLIYFLILRPRGGKSVLAYEDANGRVEVSRAAINELVQSTCQQIETVTRPKVVTYVKKGIPALRIKLKVQGEARMKDIRERLRNHLRTQLMENLGFEKLGSIDILVTSVGNLPVMPAPAVPQSFSTPEVAVGAVSAVPSTIVSPSEDSDVELDDRELEEDQDKEREKLS